MQMKSFYERSEEKTVELKGENIVDHTGYKQEVCCEA